MRRAMIGAAALALALCMTACNGGSNAATAINDTPAASADSSDTSAAESVPDDQVDDNLGDPSDVSDGLSIRQVLNDYMTVNDGVDTMMASEYIEDWLTDAGYVNASVVELDEDNYIIGGTARFYIDGNDPNSKMFEMRFDISSDGVVSVNIHNASFVDRDKEYKYTSDYIPPVDQVREITNQNFSD